MMDAAYMRVSTGERTFFIAVISAMSDLTLDASTSLHLCVSVLVGLCVCVRACVSLCVCVVLAARCKLCGQECIMMDAAYMRFSTGERTFFIAVISAMSDLRLDAST